MYRYLRLNPAVMPGRGIADGIEAEGLDGFNPVTVSRRSALVAGGLGLFASSLPSNGASAQPASAMALPDYPIGKTHELPSTKETVSSGVLDPTRGPAITVESGDVVYYPNTWTHWGNEAKYGMTFEEREPIRKKYASGPYSNVGPVAVRGAVPGDMIELRFLKMRPIDWGWTSFPLGVGALPNYFDRPYLRYMRFDADRETTEFVSGVRLKLAPSQGIVAVQPAGDKPVSGILTGSWGGNLDLAELVVGTSLFLPVQRPGGLVWTADTNALQSDGVVCQTGIESAMEDMRIQYILHKNVPHPEPVVETPTHWIAFGLGDNLDVALADCVVKTLKLGHRLSGLDERDLYALYSLTASFRVTQYSNQTGSVYSSVPPKMIHAMLPKSIFSTDMRDRMSRALRPA
ncbi:MULTISPECIES: acetamidase/formamidase family protein [unclassified Beijerinckia]|uniref:acetamidase/formamidase family protein n=1 Tax=unclassified Beijerinckia TaxID=2638183 RepID=UPI000898AEDB|nr:MULTISPECIES: acetamidase/formamidase family protein [unclassified Beijerinckia]MDH7799056.1 acetamidase/formamidase [Beijerinckia sp. GAS462]SED96506.1 Acetamidase/formamidase [Beijerinckia sp. 28-YEA-48]